MLLALALALAPPAGAQKGGAPRKPEARADAGASGADRAVQRAEAAPGAQGDSKIAPIFGSEPEKWGVVAVRIRDRQLVYAHNPDQLLQPASNQKAFTTAAVLDALGPNWTTKTSVYATARPGADGAIDGDLVLYGRGDPNLSGRFSNDDPLGPFETLASKLRDAGVRSVRGALVADDSYLDTAPYGSGWSSEDLQWWFGAEVSALSFNDNLVGLRITPGAPGERCKIALDPDVGYVAIQNDTTTGGPARITVHRELDSNVIDVGGTLPAGSAGWTGSVSVFQPPLYAAAAFRRALGDAGIDVAGPTRRLTSSMIRPGELELDRLVELASLESRPLGELVRTINKHSQNLHAELMLRLLGRERGETGLPSDAAGAGAVRAFLERTGVAADGMRVLDGSGLSRLDRVTASMLERLALTMAGHPNGGAWFDSLPIAGVDGTLRGRLSGQQIHAKTGSLETAKSLSGYLTTRAGERLAFSIIYNDPGGTGDGIGKIDRIAAALATL